MIRAVSFDLDGTLIDATEAIVESYNHVFDTIGEPRPSLERILTGIGRPLREELRLLTAYDTEECARIYRDHFFAIAREWTRILPGAYDVLEKLRGAGLRLGVATSRITASAERLLGYFGLADYFECCIGPDAVRYAKPHPEAVEACLRALGVSADEMFFVGDTHFDAEAASGAEVRCLGVTTGHVTRETLEALGMEAVFENLSQVGAYILEHRDGVPSKARQRRQG